MEKVKENFIIIMKNGHHFEILIKTAMLKRPINFQTHRKNSIKAAAICRKLNLKIERMVIKNLGESEIWKSGHYCLIVIFSPKIWFENLFLK